MNLTLHKPHPKGGTIAIVYPQKDHPVQSSPAKMQKQEKGTIGNGKCGSFMARLCMDQHQIDPNDQNQVYQNSRNLPEMSRIRHLHPKQSHHHSSSRRKIALSISHSQSRFQTPKKQSVQVNTTKYHSESKRIKTHTGISSQHNSPGQHGRKQNHRNISQSPKLKTVHAHQMKQSLKPSTNITSPNSAKKSVPLSSQKLKLSISNTFKSQIHPQVHYLSIPDTSNRGEPLHGSSRQVVDQSFMTAKLKNIYGELNSQSSAQHPPSNIVYYNQIMINQQLWKKQSEKDVANQEIQIQNMFLLSEQRSEDNRILDSQLLLSEDNQVPRNSSIPHLDSHIKNQNIIEKVQSYEVLSPEAKINQKIIQKLRERKKIGQYAPTIKSVHFSQNKSQQESIVLQRGFQQPTYQHYVSPIFSRGSMRDSNKEPNSQPIFRRHCNSFGGDELNEDRHTVKKQLLEWSGSAIEEDCLSEPDS